MCGWVAEVVDFEKITPEQRKALGKWLRAQKADVMHRLEEVNKGLRAYNKSRQRRPGADLHVIKRGA